jgi:putative flavoprotein involved in K+ transport
MNRTDVLVIGAGQAGLAMSACLRARGMEHVLLERGAVAERWRSNTWDSLRLLTPNWMTRLPGHAYCGDEPGGFMHKNDVVRLLEKYCRSIAAPIQTSTRVLRAVTERKGYRVSTDRGPWWARAVVIATGACHETIVPAWARQIPDSIAQVLPEHYRSPQHLPAGGVLVVGASSTGAQLAEEIRLSGRPVTLSVGRHIPVPRRYRGRDVMDWLDAAGVLNRRAETVSDLGAARRQPSMQLVGREGPDLDLAHLERLGIDLVGRTLGFDGHRVRLGEELQQSCAEAAVRRRRLLDRIDAFIRAEGDKAESPAETPLFVPPYAGRGTLDLRSAGISSVVWATGYRRDYDWLALPLTDSAGELRHDLGHTSAPGVYALGLRFLRRRNSNFIDGVGRDAEELAADIARHLRHRPARAGQPPAAGQPASHRLGPRSAAPGYARQRQQPQVGRHKGSPPGTHQPHPPRRFRSANLECPH